MEASFAKELKYYSLMRKREVNHQIGQFVILFFDVQLPLCYLVSELVLNE